MLNVGSLLPLALQNKEKLVRWRRDFHEHPEIAYEEFRTSSIVADHLKSLGLEVRTQVGKTGVVGLLRGEEPGPTFALRADMDALPIQDQKDAAYRSKHAGKAHLCGHDAHTSILMGAAELLAGLGKPKRGNVKFIFQPAEEGGAGAKAMMDDGALRDPKVDAIAGLHMYPGLPTGSFGVTRGTAFASVDSIEIKIFGKGGHAARPHEGVDAIAVSAQVITALQHIASRMVDPLDPVVVSIGKLSGGVMGTVIADEVSMSGTIRTLSSGLRSQMPALVEQVIRGVTESMGAKYELDYIMSYPVVRNDDGMVDFLTRTNEKLFGDKRWSYLKPSTGGEDFGFYAEEIPGVFFRLGSGDGRAETSYPLHHPKFDLDEEALPYGAAMLSALAVAYLSGDF